MKKKNQILFIHGGMTFKSHKDYLDFLKNRPISIDKKIKWHDVYLENALKDNFQIIKPRMPLSDNAKYNEWKIYFERYFDQLKNNIILIGQSLGGIFLAKYLSENIFPKKIISVFLVCPPFDNTLSEEDLVGGFKLQSDLSLIEKNCKNINLLFSQDDDCVPVNHSEKYRNKLKNPNIIVYKSKNGHFKVFKFPEIVKMIKNDFKKFKRK